MSLLYDSDNYELSTSQDIDDILADLHFDLLKESIIEQVQDPTSTHVNYIDVILDKCKMYKSTNDDPDIISQIDESLTEFLTFVMREIDKKFDLGLDIDTISTSPDVIETGTAVYVYFILRYVKNIGNYISKYIIKNKKTLADEFSDSNKKDVSTLAFRKQIKDKDDLIILTNLASIIKEIIYLDADPKEFVELTSKDNYEQSIVLSLIDSGLLTGSFVLNYFEESIDGNDYIIDEIHTNIKTKLIKKINL